MGYLNKTKWSVAIPEELKGIYDDEKYAKSQNYERVNHKFSILTSSFNLFLILVFLYLQGFAFIDEIFTCTFSSKTKILTQITQWFTVIIKWT